MSLVVLKQSQQLANDEMQDHKYPQTRPHLALLYAIPTTSNHIISACSLQQIRCINPNISTLPCLNFFSSRASRASLSACDSTGVLVRAGTAVPLVAGVVVAVAATIGVA
jgi:hypothetical protein